MVPCRALQPQHLGLWRPSMFVEPVGVHLRGAVELDEESMLHRIFVALEHDLELSEPTAIDHLEVRVDVPDEVHRRVRK